MTQANNVAIQSSQINSSGVLQVSGGGTGVTTSTGSGNNVLSTSPTLVTPVLGTPTSGTLTSCTGLPLSTGVTGTLPVANGGTGTASPATVAGTGISVSGSFPNQTVTNSGVTSIVAGTGISISGATGAVTITNSSSVNATQLCKAWFQMGVSGTTVTINGNYNISSIVRNGTGLYTVNFTSAMANANYCALICNSAKPGSSDSDSEIFTSSGSNVTAPTTSAFIFVVKENYSGGQWDPTYATGAVFN